MPIKNLLEEIDSKKKELDSLRPIKSNFLRNIQQKMNISYNYHSNHLEGNSLTYQETRSFIQTGLIQASKENQKYRDYKEIEWHDRAIKSLWLIDKLDYTEDLLKKDELKITQNIIRELHQMILVENHKIQKRDENWEHYLMKIKVGEYKSKDNFIRKTSDWAVFKYVKWQKVGEKMYDLLNWLDKNKDNHHPLVVCSMFHYKFIRIHPFDDGNGRMARLLMNMILMYYAYPLVIIPSDEKWKRWYYDSLEIVDSLLPDIEDTINTNDELLFENFTNYLWNKLLESMDWVIRGAKWEDILNADDMLKKFKLEMKVKSEWNKVENDINRIYNKNNKKMFFENILYPIINSINKFGESIVDLYEWVVDINFEFDNKKIGFVILKWETIHWKYRTWIVNILDDLDFNKKEGFYITLQSEHKARNLKYKIRLRGLKNIGEKRDDHIQCECSFHQWKIDIFVWISTNYWKFTKKYWDITPIKEEKEMIQDLINKYKSLTKFLYI